MLGSADARREYLDGCHVPVGNEGHSLCAVHEYGDEERGNRAIAPEGSDRGVVLLLFLVSPVPLS